MEGGTSAGSSLPPSATVVTIVVGLVIVLAELWLDLTVFKAGSLGVWARHGISKFLGERE